MYYLDDAGNRVYSLKVPYLAIWNLSMGSGALLPLPETQPNFAVFFQIGKTTRKGNFLGIASPFSILKSHSRKKKPSCNRLSELLVRVSACPSPPSSPPPRFTYRRCIINHAITIPLKNLMPFHPLHSAEGDP